MANRDSVFKIQQKVEANTVAAAGLADRLLAEQPELSKKIRRALMCGPSEARQGIIEVVKFMWLAAEGSTGRLTPAHRVDLAWHELILFTRTYQQVCEDCFGKFVHHQPESHGQDSEQQFTKTLNRYREVFGAPPKEFWGIFGSGENSKPQLQQDMGLSTRQLDTDKTTHPPKGQKFSSTEQRPNSSDCGSCET